MNREEAKQLQGIINAYAKGYTIQQRIDDEWIDLVDPDFNNDVNEYRVKPEPKYRPFDCAEECWNEMQKHQPFGWLKDRKYGERNRTFVTHIDYANDVVWVDPIEEGMDFEYAFEWFTFEDGTPFGIKED
jgi:hypothetical protein